LRIREQRRDGRQAHLRPATRREPKQGSSKASADPTLVQVPAGGVTPLRRRRTPGRRPVPASSHAGSRP